MSEESLPEVFLRRQGGGPAAERVPIEILFDLETDWTPSEEEAVRALAACIQAIVVRSHGKIGSSPECLNTPNCQYLVLQCQATNYVTPPVMIYFREENCLLQCTPAIFDENGELRAYEERRVAVLLEIANLHNDHEVSLPDHKFLPPGAPLPANLGSAIDMLKFAIFCTKTFFDAVMCIPLLTTVPSDAFLAPRPLVLPGLSVQWPRHLTMQYQALTGPIEQCHYADGAKVRPAVEAAVQECITWAITALLEDDTDGTTLPSSEKLDEIENTLMLDLV